MLVFAKLVVALEPLVLLGRNFKHLLLLLATMYFEGLCMLLLKLIARLCLLVELLVLGGLWSLSCK